MMHEAIEHPTTGWNELPHEPGSYAWWDGTNFTMIAFRADDHWEYVNDQEQPPRARKSTLSHNPLAWTSLVVGVGDLLLYVFLLGFILGPIGLALGIVGLRAADRPSEIAAALGAIALGAAGLIVGAYWVANLQPI